MPPENAIQLTDKRKFSQVIPARIFLHNSMQADKNISSLKLLRKSSEVFEEISINSPRKINKESLSHLINMDC